MTDGPIERDPPGQRISYAQNGEDVRLWRAFEGIEEGFYVEVGGWDPEIDSISRSFYGRGWSGIVVEPVEEYAEQFRLRRPRDHVVQALAGAQDGEAEFHVFPQTGLSTSVADHWARHETAGEQSETRTSPVIPLDRILQSHAGVVHFMVVDVEGAEAEVLAGIELAVHRPWVLVIEATLPRTATQDFGRWEPGVLAAGYEFVAFDGINRFYVAQEHAYLAAAIAVPANVLDDFQRLDQVTHLRQIAELRAELGQWRDRAAEVSAAHDVQVERTRALEEDLRHRGAELVSLTRELEALREERARLQSDLSAVLASRSWRVTAPLRRLGGPR